MQQYNTEQKKKIVKIISKTKNKKAQALKFNISIRSYYYWKKKLEEKYQKLLLLEEEIRRKRNN